MPTGKHSARPASAKRRYKNVDRHRFRKVFVWVIPIILSIPVTMAFIAKGTLFRWCVIVSLVIFVGYILFLLEWYVWRENPARKRARIGFGFFCLLAVICGILLQRLINDSPTLAFLFGERPYLSVYQAQPFYPQAGTRALIQIAVHNRGDAPARSVHAAGKAYIREWHGSHDCPPVVYIEHEDILDLGGDTFATGETKWALVGSNEVLSEDAVNSILSGRATILATLVTDYGRDGKTTPYRTKYYAYFDHRVKLFVPCPQNNAAN